MVAFQGTLFDQEDEIAPRPLGASLQRRQLGEGAWIDLHRNWISGADALFEELSQNVPWKAEERQMYDRTVGVPRLLCFYSEGEPLPHPSLELAMESLAEHYQIELGEPFRTVGLCLYRDGGDSVAWHGDRIGRGSTEDTMVAIVSIGEARSLQLRPSGGRTALRFQLGRGDLLVMGGSCQRTWEHRVPKTARSVGPRISIQFRPRGVR